MRKIYCSVSGNYNYTINFHENANLRATTNFTDMTQRGNFDWVAYLKECGAQAAPANAFRQSIEAPDNKFDIGMKLEARDPRNSTAMCIATVVDVAGPRIALRLDGTDDRNDFWRLVDSAEIAPLGTTPSINDEKNKQQPGLLLQPPFAFMKREREWTRMYQAALQDVEQHAPLSCFKPQPPSPARNLFAPGMKLEAVDRKNARLICVATIGDVRNDQVLVKFDGWRGTPDYWTRYDSRDLFPVGWCEKVHHSLEPPGPGYTGAVGRVRVQNAPTVAAKASASVKSRPNTNSKRHNAADSSAQPESNGKAAHAHTDTSTTQNANSTRHDSSRSRKRRADENNQRCKKDSAQVAASYVKRQCVIVAESDAEKVRKGTKQVKVELSDVIANSHLNSKPALKSKGSQQKDKNQKKEQRAVYDERSGEKVKQNSLKPERLSEPTCEVSTAAVAPFKAESESMHTHSERQPNSLVDEHGQPVHTACARDPLDQRSTVPMTVEIKSELKHEQERERERESSGSRSDTPSTVQTQTTVENRAESVSSQFGVASEPNANRTRMTLECPAPKDISSFEAAAKDQHFVKASSPVQTAPVIAARRPSFSFSIDSLLKPTESTSVRSTTPISWYPPGFVVLPTFVAPPNAVTASPLHSQALRELAQLTFNAHAYGQPVAVANGSTHTATNATTNGSKYANGHTVGDSNSNSTTQACGECRRLLATSLPGWTVTDVTHYLSHCDTSFAPDIDVFTRHEIDGEALALLTSELLVRHLGMKLGPAVKTMRLVDELKAKLKHCLSPPLVTTADSQVERSAA